MNAIKTKRRALALLAASTVLAALVVPALGAETTGRAPPPETPGVADDTVSAVDPVQFATLPWMSTSDGRAATIEGLAGAKVSTLGPFLLDPSSPPSGFVPDATK